METLANTASSPAASTTPQDARGPRVREIEAAIPDDFCLALGERLDNPILRARLIGPETGPLVVVTGGISSDRHPDVGPDGEPGWWPWAVRDGGPIDTRRLRVLAFDLSPGRDSRRIVTLTTQDQARLLAILLDAAGEPVIDAFVGASYGGAVALAFAELFPERIRHVVTLSAAHRTHPMATAWRGVQRRILALGVETGREAEAVALARELAMTTYRTGQEFQQRFGDGAVAPRAGEGYAVCDYLQSRGRDYASVTTPQRWITLSDALDRHSVQPERITTAVTVIGFTTDQLCPIEDLRELADRLPNRQRLVEAPSLYGHDAFLKERAVVTEALSRALAPLLADPARHPDQEIAA